MTHDRIQEVLSDWIDGELSAEAGAEVAAHVDACASCAREAALRRRLGAALFQAPPPVDPRSTEAFVARVMGRVAADAVSPWERFAGRVLTPAFGLALAVLLFTIAAPSADEDAPLGVAASVDAEFVLGVTP